MTQVTNMPDGACQPAWSPDGQRLVFISPCPGRKEIYERASLYIINRDGSGLTALPASPEGDFDPAWCPDGRRIAFTSIRTGQPRVFVLNLEDNSILRISTSPYGDRYPAWSPSGGQLAFVRYRTAAQIWITSDTGQNEFAFTRSGAFNDIMPFWAPDSETIYYSQSSEPGSAAWLSGMFYEDRGTSKEFRVTLGGKPGPFANGHPSPDGLWIVYESWPTGANHDIYRMTVNGANVVRLTTDPGLDFDPAWNPAPEPR
jgi:Tol biopolymer transport system component